MPLAACGHRREKESINLMNLTKGLVLLAVVFAQQAASSEHGKSVDPHVETVSLCKLAKEWKKYDRRTVRIDAIYQAADETSVVYDTGCPTSDHTAWVALLPYRSPSPVPSDLKASLDQLLKQDRRARITVVGEFDGPTPLDAGPGSTSETAPTNHNPSSRYGYNNYWEFQFVFSRIEKVGAVPASDPWPSWATENSK
jgi:hypothetical protein